MGMWLYYNISLTVDQEQEARKLLESQGYTEHQACGNSFVHPERCIISLGFDRNLFK